MTYVRASPPSSARPSLPPDLWVRWERASMWRAPEFNTLHVAVAGEAAEANLNISQRQPPLARVGAI